MSKLKRVGLKVKVYKRYVDDGNMGLRAVKQGVRV